MPSTKLLKERIESIQDTMKITNAMYLISSSKLRKARKNYQNVLPYFCLLYTSPSPRDCS